MLLILGNVALVLVGAFLWFRRESRLDYAVPDGGVNPKVYRLLERARRGIFHGRDAVRFTIFGIDHENANQLRPIARLGWGRASRNSEVRFRIGEGLAGTAWLTQGYIIVARVDAPSTDTAREENEKLFNLRPETADGLSDEQLSSRALIAVHLASASGQFRGVLCIDSKDAALVPAVNQGEEFWSAVDQLATALAAALVDAGSHVSISENEMTATDDARLFQLKVA